MTMSTVLPSAATLWMASITSVWWPMSRALVGSSSKMRSASWASTMASQTRWAWPPDSELALCCQMASSCIRSLAQPTMRASSSLHWVNQP
ncbi:hypothetical protein D3C71_782440 [compost metagenome]